MGKYLAYLQVALLLCLLSLCSCAAGLFPTDPALHENPKHNYFYRHPYPVAHKFQRDPSLANDTLKVVRYVRPAKHGRPAVVAQAGDSLVPASSAAGLLRKCKGCQITLINGNSNRVSQGRTGKVRAPAAIASDSATAVDQRGASQAAANTGKGSTSSQAQAKPKPTIAQLLLGPLGVGLGIIVSLVLLILLLAAWLKRRTPHV